MPSIEYPYHRARRLRQNSNIRDLVRENIVTSDDLIMPYFIIEGENLTQPIASMPSISRLSLDLLIKELEKIVPLGLKAIALFPITPDTLKDDIGQYALSEDNLICRAIRQIKQLFPDLLIISDVALDPYTIHGHDGILDETGYMQNDATINVLVQQSLNQMYAGADIIAPSDMCDGRIGAIRKAFEAKKAVNTLIMAYSIKYVSGFYGPFRDAVNSSGQLVGDKKTYQMDFANSKEAFNEAALDIQEGADIIIIKPAMLYLDIIQQISHNFNVPICGYQVSGEYAMVNFAAQQNFAPRHHLILESLTALKRSGCQLILSYFTKEWLENNY